MTQWESSHIESAGQCDVTKVILIKTPLTEMLAIPAEYKDVTAIMPTPESIAFYTTEKAEEKVVRMVE